MSSLGQDFARVDGPAKLRGSAQFTADIEMAGMVYAKVLRSTYTHARLLRVDASKAAKLPGVVAVLTRDDLEGMNAYFGPVVKDQPVVAIDRVRYVGDIVAAVAAEEKDVAEEALELIEVNYESLPAVFDPAEAVKPGAPILHGESAKSETRLDRDNFRYEKGSNVLTIYHAEQGDVAAGFKEADEIFEDVYSSQKIQHAHIEPHAALAYWEPSGKLVIYTSTQNPSSIRVQLAELFNLPQSKVRVIVPYVGGGYGGKVHPRLEPLTATLARKAHRPAQWVLSRDCLKRAAQAVGWREKEEQKDRELTGKVRGKGLAVMIKTTMTPSNSSALVRLNADGSAVLLTSSVEIGQGTQTSLAQIVAEELGISPERVSVTFPDTDVTPFDQSTSSSRTLFTMWSAARQAAAQIRQQLLEIGSHALEANVEDLELRDGHLQVRGAPEKRRTISQLFQAHYGAAVGSMAASYDNQTRGGVDPKTGKGKASAFFFLSACAAEVAVDTETGKVTIEKIVSVVDAGKAVNPRQCHMQNEGSMIMSLGSALFEEMVFDGGQPINATFLEYMPPSMEDHPQQFQSLIVRDTASGGAV